MPGRASGGAAVARLMGLDDGTTSIGRPRRGRARRFYTDVLSQLIGRLQEFVPSSRLIPSSPATFPCTSMIRCAFLSSFSSRAFRRSSLRTFSSRRISLRLAAAFLRQGLQRPAMRRLAPRRQVRRVQALSPQELTHLGRARCTGPLLRRIRSLYDGLNRRRSGLSTTSGSAGAAALRLASPVPGALPFSSILSRSPNMFVFSAFAYSNSLRAPCLTYVGREGGNSKAWTWLSIWRNGTMALPL